MSYTETKIISLNASDGTCNNGSYLSDITFNTNNLFNSSDDVLNTYIEITNAQIPVSFYILNYTCNVFKMKVDTDPDMIMTIPVGNYTSTTLLALLNTLHANMIFSFDKTTGKINITHNRPFIIYNNFQYSIGSILGFDVNTVNYSVGTSNPYTLTPPNLLNLLGIKKLNIFSSDLEIHNMASGANNNTVYSSLVGVIPNSAPPYGMIDYRNYSNIQSNITNKNIDTINIQVKDENLNFINFNNISFTITLILHIERKLKTTENIEFYKLLNKFIDGKKEDKNDNINYDPELELLTKINK